MTVSAPTAGGLLAAALFAATVFLALAPPAGGARRWGGRHWAGEYWAGGHGDGRSWDGGTGTLSERGRGEAEDDLLGRHRGLVALLAAGAPVVLLGGPLGMVSAVVAGLVTWRAIGAREPASLKRRRERVARDLPHVVDLLAVTLASGAAPAAALALVASAVDGPVVDDLRSAERSLALGRDPERVWRELAERPGLSSLGRAMVRAVETGASVSDALHRLADDLHATARLDAETRARAVGVRAAAPLGLCLLPAFILVGVVPLVGSTALALLSR